MLALIILLVWTAIIIGISAIYVPAFLFAVTLTIFAGLVVVIFYAEISLADLQVENRAFSRKFNAVFENMREGGIIYTSKFKILNLNQAALKILGVRSSEVINKVINPDSIKNKKLRTLTQIIFPSLAPTVKQISEDGWPQIIEISTDNPELQLITVLDRFVDEKGEIVGFIKIIKDQTREKNLIQSKNEFIATSTHQLRTPLTAISWALEEINDSFKGEEGLKEITTQAMELSKRALKILDDLVEVIHIEEGKYGFTFEKFDFKKLANDIIEQAKIMTRGDNITLKLKSPPEECFIKGDKNRLGVVLSTLIDNAIKYNTENGSVTVSYQKLPDGSGLKVAIRDTGVGISEKEMKGLFQKFYRGSEAAKMEPNGSGLGLYIAKGVVEKHGGKIWAESAVGRGSTFYFTLPAKQGA